MTATNNRPELLAQLTEGVAKLTTSDEWQHFLDYQSRFRSYSFGNVLLIAAQRPTASRVAGFHAWHKLGRHVLKGEKAIWILAPMVYKQDDADAGDNERVIRGFKYVPVWDPLSGVSHGAEIAGLWEDRFPSARVASGTSVGQEDLLEQLQSGIRELASSEAWLRWLAVQAKFWKYSPGNCLLIAMQRPDASMVAGYRRWIELGRQVRKGEKGIRILAPCRIRVASGDNDDEGVNHVEVVRRFRSTAVFALEQTEGDALPEIPIARLGGGDATHIDALRGYTEGLGFRVEMGEFGESNTCGVTNFSAHTVTLARDLSPTHMQKTMFHELAHISLHSECTLARSVAELEAESVAWICCNAVGVAADAYSFAYCAAWVGGGDEATSQIRASAERIHQTVRVILEGIGIASAGTP